MQNIPITTFELTRWRDLNNPLSPLDPIQSDSPRYEEGHIPAGFVVLLWDGTTLAGPIRFETQEEADNYLKPPFYNTSVCDLPMSVRVAGCVVDSLGIKTAGELYDATDNYLLKARNLGKVSLREIRSLLPKRPPHPVTHYLVIPKP